MEGIRWKNEILRDLGWRRVWPVFPPHDARTAIDYLSTYGGISWHASGRHQLCGIIQGELMSAIYALVPIDIKPVMSLNNFLADKNKYDTQCNVIFGVGVIWRICPKGISIVTNLTQRSRDKLTAIFWKEILISWLKFNGNLFLSITLTSQWPWWRLKSPASRLFTQSFTQVQIKENIKAPRHWPLCGEFWVKHWFM